MANTQLLESNVSRVYFKLRNRSESTLFLTVGEETIELASGESYENQDYKGPVTLEYDNESDLRLVEFLERTRG